jgi:hypothetical protein
VCCMVSGVVWVLCYMRVVGGVFGVVSMYMIVVLSV